MAYKHGIYVTERPTSLVAPIEGTAGLQVIFGTAPVNLASDPSGAVNVPKLCYSYEEAVAAVGFSYDFEKYTLCQSIYACFNIFNIAPIILVNVLDPATHKTAVPAADMAVTGGQAKIQSASVPVFGVIAGTVVVAPGGGGTAFVAGTDYTLTFDGDGSCVITPISAACLQEPELNIAYSKLDPEAVDKDDVIGTYNAATGASSGLQLIREIYPRFGMTPGLIVAPGWSHLPDVATVMQAKCEEINGCFSCETILDIHTEDNDDGIPYAIVYSDVKTAKEDLGASSPHAVACWPMVRSGSHKLFMSAVWGALTAYTDANNDDVPSLSPSNKNMRITATVLGDGIEVLLDQAQANTVNSYGVNTALNINGFKSWGNNSCAYPSTTDPKDRWWCNRRFFTWAGNSFILTYFQKVDNPADRRLIESIVDSVNITGNGYVARGYCAAYRMEYLESENTTTDLLNGQITFHQYLSPYTPAENIENILEFDTDALSAALGGE